MKILVIEDKPNAAEYLRQGLIERGYAVEVARDYTDGPNAAANADHEDLLVLDVKLPGTDSVRSAVRTSKRPPVFMLTTRATTNDKLSGVDLRAADYPATPFAFPELLDRVCALLQGGQPPDAGPNLRASSLEIDPVCRRAIREGHRIDLSAKEFALLTLLAQRPGQVLSRAQLASMVWDIHFESDTNVVEVTIRRLRAKLDDPFPDKLIHTVRGAGYVFEYRATS